MLAWAYRSGHEAPLNSMRLGVTGLVEDFGPVILVDYASCGQ